MKGWAGPLLLFGDLAALALAFLTVLGLAGFVFWLVAQPWVWLFLLGLGPVALAGVYLCWRSAPATLPAADAPTGYRLVPTYAPVHYCDACGSALRGGLCPYCDGL